MVMAYCFTGRRYGGCYSALRACGHPLRGGAAHAFRARQGGRLGGLHHTGKLTKNYILAFYIDDRLPSAPHGRVVRLALVTLKLPKTSVQHQFQVVCFKTMLAVLEGLTISRKKQITCVIW